MKKLLAIIALVVFAGCSKEEFPENQVVSQAFVITGSIDGEEFDFSPGTNGLFLYTDVDSNEDGNHFFSAHVAPENGSEDHGQLIFELYAWEEEGSSEEFLNELTPGEIGLGNAAFESSVFNYETEASDLSNFEINVNGEVSTDLEGELNLSGNPDLTINIQQEVEEATCFRNGQYFFGSFFGCFSSFESSSTEIVIEEDEIIITPPLVPDDAIVIWNFETLEIDLVETIGNEPFVLSEANPGLIISYTIEVFYEGEFLISVNETIFNLVDISCEINSVDFEKELIADPVIGVTYINASGDVYNSLLPCELVIIQPETSFVELVDIEDFQSNQNGLPTKRVTLNGDLLLFDEEFTGGFVPIQFENLSIAFPYQD